MTACGPIGALALAVLKRSGAARITAVDMQADVVIESSGSHQGLASAIQGAARGGTLVSQGLKACGVAKNSASGKVLLHFQPE